MILTCDTSHRRGSLGLVHGGELLDERRCEPVAEMLMPTLQELLTSQNTSLPQIELYAVTSGPGSFTGLRIGLSAIKTLALMHKKPAVAVSTLQALALGAHRLAGESREMAERPLAALAHASGEDFFVTAYGAVAEQGDGGFWSRPCVMQDQLIHTDTLSQMLPPDCLLIGEAAELFTKQHLTHPGGAIRRIGPLTPQAMDIALLAERNRHDSAWQISSTTQPRYLRLSAAEQRRGKASI